MKRDNLEAVLKVAFIKADEVLHNMVGEKYDSMSDYDKALIKLRIVVDMAQRDMRIAKMLAKVSNND